MVRVWWGLFDCSFVFCCLSIEFVLCDCFVWLLLLCSWVGLWCFVCGILLLGNWLGFCSWYWYVFVVCGCYLFIFCVVLVLMCVWDWWYCSFLLCVWLIDVLWCNDFWWNVVVGIWWLVDWLLNFLMWYEVWFCRSCCDCCLLGVCYWSVIVCLWWCGRIGWFCEVVCVWLVFCYEWIWCCLWLDSWMFLLIVDWCGCYSGYGFLE